MHTNAVIFAFVEMVFYWRLLLPSRLLKTRMFSDLLSIFAGLGLAIDYLAAAITLSWVLQVHEYAELEWPIDIAIALVWVVFGINMFGQY